MSFWQVFSPFLTFSVVYTFYSKRTPKIICSWKQWLLEWWYFCFGFDKSYNFSSNFFSQDWEIFAQNLKLYLNQCDFWNFMVQRGKKTPQPKFRLTLGDHNYALLWKLVSNVSESRSPLPVKNIQCESTLLPQSYPLATFFQLKQAIS